MDKRIIWGIVAYIGLFMPIIGVIVGLIRYRKYGDEVKRKVDNEYHQAQEHGGIRSLYYKHTHKRVFAKSFGTPILICLIVGLLLILLAFSKL